MSVQMIIRLDDDLKDKVNHLAKAEGKNLSQVVRELLQRYAKERDVGAYIDTLWANIGESLVQAGASQVDIDKAIKQVRVENNKP